MSIITINYDEICIFRTTDKAWAVCWGKNRRERDRSLVFLPKTLCEVDKKNHTITLPEWLVVEKGLDGYVG